MSKIFKTGDRVSVYALGVFHGPGFHKGSKGTVYQDQYDSSSSVLVQIDDYEIPAGPVKAQRLEVYPQQIRRLIPRKKGKLITREMFDAAFNGAAKVQREEQCSFKNAVARGLGL